MNIYIFIYILDLCWALYSQDRLSIFFCRWKTKTKLKVSLLNMRIHTSPLSSVSFLDTHSYSPHTVCSIPEGSQHSCCFSRKARAWGKMGISPRHTHIHTHGCNHRIQNIPSLPVFSRDTQEAIYMNTKEFCFSF